MLQYKCKKNNSWTLYINVLSSICDNYENECESHELRKRVIYFEVKRYYKTLLYIFYILINYIF